MQKNYRAIIQGMIAGDGLVMRDNVKIMLPGKPIKFSPRPDNNNSFVYYGIHPNTVYTQASPNCVLSTFLGINTMGKLEKVVVRFNPLDQMRGEVQLSTAKHAVCYQDIMFKWCTQQYTKEGGVRCRVLKDITWQLCKNLMETGDGPSITYDKDSKDWYKDFKNCREEEQKAPVLSTTAFFLYLYKVKTEQFFKLSDFMKEDEIFCSLEEAMDLIQKQKPLATFQESACIVTCGTDQELLSDWSKAMNVQKSL